MKDKMQNPRSEIPNPKSEIQDPISKLEQDIDQLSEELLNTYTEINLLYRVSEKLGSITDISAIAEITLDEIYEQIPSHRASVMLLDTNKESLSIIASRGLPKEFEKNTVISLKNSIVRDVVEKGQPLLINDLEKHNHLAARLKGDDYQTAAMVSVPLLVVPLGFKQELLGVINLSDRMGGRGYFTSNDQKLVSAVSSQASVAIKKVNLMKDLHESHQETEAAFFYTVNSLARAAEANDDDTGNHIIRVGKFSQALARELRLSDKFCEDIVHFAPMHDVGKIHVHPDILRKTGKLTDVEFNTIKAHPKSGADIIGDAHKLSMAKEIAFCHHERWNGTGYPRRLKNENIPVSARITTIADIYDALRSKRKYKPAFEHEKTFQILTKGDGRVMPDHFDPKILEAFKNIHLEFEKIYFELIDEE